MVREEKNEKKINSDKDSELDYLSAIRRKKGSRIIAWICIIIIMVLIVATFIAGITGSKYFAGCLFLCILVPLLMYVFVWVGKILFKIKD